MRSLEPVSETWARPLLLVARLGMASLAVFGGLEKIFKYPDAVNFAAAYDIPFPRETMPVAIAVELGCALLLFVPRYCRVAALVLAVWTFVLGVWFHRFWAVPAAEWQMMIDSFFHHFVMTGGFIYVAVFGTGSTGSSRTQATHTSAA